MTPYRRSTPPIPVRGNGGTTIEHDVDLSALTDADFRWLYQITAAHEEHALMVWLRDQVTEEMWRRGEGAPKKLAHLSIGEWGYEALARLIKLGPKLRHESMGPGVPAASAELMATLDSHVADLAIAVVGATGGAIADVARANESVEATAGLDAESLAWLIETFEHYLTATPTVCQWMLTTVRKSPSVDAVESPCGSWTDSEIADGASLISVLFEVVEDDGPARARAFMRHVHGLMLGAAIARLKRKG